MLYAFDLLVLDGHDLRPWKLEGRRDLLRSLVNSASRSAFLSQEFKGDGPTIFAHACKHDLVGISPSGDQPLNKTRTYLYSQGWLVANYIVSLPMRLGSAGLTRFDAGYSKNAGRAPA